MARSYPVQASQPARAARLAGQGAELLMLLMLAGLLALWVTGAPIHAFLPVDPPA